MDQRDTKLIMELKNGMPSGLAGHLRKIVVFGSRARGEPAEDSDLDLIVLVDEKTPEIERGLEDIAYEVMWDNDFKPIISLKVLTEAQFNNALGRGFSFYRYVQQEGVAV